MTKSICCQQFQHSQFKGRFYYLSFLHGQFSQRLLQGFSWAKRPLFSMLLFPVVQRGIQGGKSPQSTPVRGLLKGRSWPISQSEPVPKAFPKQVKAFSCKKSSVLQPNPGSIPVQIRAQSQPNFNGHFDDESQIHSIIKFDDLF